MNLIDKKYEVRSSILKIVSLFCSANEMKENYLHKSIKSIFACAVCVEQNCQRKQRNLGLFLLLIL